MTPAGVDRHPWVGTAADPTGYPTVVKPDMFVPDWRGFYWGAPAARNRVRERWTVDTHAYGDRDAHQILNVVRDQGMNDSPVIVYFHGGRWREGHPDYYDSLGEEWAKAGAVFISAGYRQAPRSSLGDAVDDAVAAVGWAVDHAGDLGGDPRRVWVTGHSSGAHLAAMVALTDWPGAGDLPVAGLICQSAPVDITQAGRTEAEAETMDPSRVIVRAPSRVLLAYGVPEEQRRGEAGNIYQWHAHRLAASLGAFSNGTKVVKLANANHLEVALAFGDPTSPLFRESVRMIFED